MQCSEKPIMNEFSSKSRGRGRGSKEHKKQNVARIYTNLKRLARLAGEASRERGAAVGAW